MNVYEAAFSYRDCGISVVPIAPDGSKRPLVAWKDYQTRLATDQELYEWFRGKLAGVAIVGGAVSGNLECLDFDAPGVLFEFRDVCKEYGLMSVLKTCPLVETPSGGNHLYYRYDSKAPGNEKLATLYPEVPEGTANARRIGDKCYTSKTLIETRGEGGYALVPPSPGECHKSGRPYIYRRELTLADVPTLASETITLMHSIARSFGHPSPTVPTRHAREYTQTSGLTPWDDFDRRGANEARAALEASGWTLARSDGNREEWRRPGKRDGISATFDYCSKDGVPLFYVFSSNAFPFEPQQGYGPYNVVKLLQYGGDPSAAARDLARQGFGKHD